MGRVLGLIFVCCVLVVADPAAAGQEQDLDDVLSGFEDIAQPPANGENELDDVLSGFEEDGEQRSDSEDEESSVSGFSGQDFSDLDFSGSFSLGSSFAVSHNAPQPNMPDQRGLSRLKAGLDLQLDMRLSSSWKARLSGKAFYDYAYRIRGRSEYSGFLLENYEKEADVGESYIRGELAPRLDFTVGRQIVVWGRSDNIRVTDVLNPLDSREPGLVDIKDLRLPVFMSRLDYYHGKVQISGVVIHERRFNKEPVPGNDFFPVAGMILSEIKPSSTLANQELGLNISSIFSGWDASVYAATFFNDQSHIEITPTGLIRRHARMKMFGGAANLAWGNWLVKTEAAWLDGFLYTALPGRDFSRLDLMAGFEYSGISETTVALEAVNRHINNFRHQLRAMPDGAWRDEFQSVVRIIRDFANDRVQVVGLASLIGVKGEGGAMERLSISYDVNDIITVTGGAVSYQSGNRSFYKNIGDNDRLFLEFSAGF